jgi:Tfp pilus assembly protein PilF
MRKNNLPQCILSVLLIFLVFLSLSCRRSGERISRSNQKVAQFYFSQAELNIKKNHLKIAAKQLERGLNLNPDAKKEYLKLAVIYKTLGDRINSVRVFKEITHKFPHTPEAKLAHREINKIVISVRQKIIFSD